MRCFSNGPLFLEQPRLSYKAEVREAANEV
jgi:hypothetical protein